MDRGAIKTELQVILRDPTVESSFDTWIQDELLQLAYEFDLPMLRLRTPASLVVNNAAWQYNLTAATHASSFTFHKKLYRVTNALFETGMRIDTDLNIIDDIDPDHTDTGTNVQRVAYELDLHNNAILGTWPMASETLSLWFYRRPTTMTVDTNIPEFPDAHHFDVLIPRIVLRAFRLYPELATEVAGDATRALALWTQRYQSGLYGDNGNIGLIDTLRKSRPVRVRGPRPGMGLSGADRFLR
mgnify:FL=1